jgi:dihydroorotase
LRPPAGLAAYDTSTKVNPPLRSWQDVHAVVAGLADGTIDAIATDHAPHASIDKECEYAAAAFGISGLETALGLILHLVHTGQLDLLTALYRLSTGPAAIAGDRLPPGAGTLTVGAPADLVVFDPDAAWTVRPERFASKGRNTPLAGATLRGVVHYTLVDGAIVWDVSAAGVMA